jgi:5-methyltetrahydropteroyltriglutamate--homocysteine methyltransferase
VKRSTDHILTTHTGSLPRPPELTVALEGRDRGEPVAADDLAKRVRDGVVDVVRRQCAAGIQVVNDGEASKIGYSTYVKERLDGFGGEGPAPAPPPDADDFPEYWAERNPGRGVVRPACTGPLSSRERDAVAADIANLRAALDGVDGVDVADAFMTAASPGVIAHFLDNQYYPDHEAYVFALADVMKQEYDEIHRAGFVLQLDCPDLTARCAGESLEDTRRRTALHLEALGHATRDIPESDLRLHLCWGNYEGPHTRDVPLADILDLALAARPAGLSFEGANPRHAHEWALFADVDLPDGKVLIPGVIDSTTNYVEHPELVAQRVCSYVGLVGRENVIAGTDCGFATFATSLTVHSTITWAKLRALADGASIASDRLWNGAGQP